MFNLKKIKRLEDESKKKDDMLKQQGMALNNVHQQNREMFMGPLDFILSPSQATFKDIKVTFKGKDITHMIDKIMMYGPSVMEEIECKRTKKK